MQHQKIYNQEKNYTRKCPKALTKPNTVHTHTHTSAHARTHFGVNGGLRGACPLYTTVCQDILPNAGRILFLSLIHCLLLFVKQELRL